MLVYSDGEIKIYARAIKDEDVKAQGREAAQHSTIADILREAFPENRDVRIAHYPSGAPYLVGSDRSISISHCSEAAMLAVCESGRRIGIDCETTSRRHQLDRVKERFLSPSQLPYWGVFPKSLQAWGIKEALYKAFLTPGVALMDIPLPSSLPGTTDQDGSRYKLLPITTPFTEISTILAYSIDK